MVGTKIACSARGLAGHTLVELAIAMAIIAILAAIGVSSLQAEIARYHLIQAARLLHTDLNLLKAEAIASNREMRLKFVAADEEMDPGAGQEGAWLLQAGNRSAGSTTWDTLPLDDGDDVTDAAGTHDLSEEGRQSTNHVSLAPWPALAGPPPGGSNADAVVYSPRGFLVNPAADFTDGYLVFTLVNKYALARGIDERVTVRVSRGGMARIEAGPSSTLPTNPVGTAEASTP